jgi:hemerythrin-like metal-binding protein
MWKEELRIGVDAIDEQHKALCRKTEELLRELNSSAADHKQKCIDAIVFLKGYAVRHFADEEAYQEKIGYKGLEAHRKLHAGFVQAVLLHEKNMTASDFAEKDVKAFTGMLVAWLLYHIADSDQKITHEPAQEKILHEHNDIVCYGICDTLNKMAGYDVRGMTVVSEHTETFADAVSVEVGLKEDVTGYIVLVYPVSFVKKFIGTIMGFEPDMIDELEISALYEVSNIIIGTICRQISRDMNIVCDITTP